MKPKKFFNKIGRAVAPKRSRRIAKRRAARRAARRETERVRAQSIAQQRRRDLRAVRRMRQNPDANNDRRRALGLQPGTRVVTGAEKRLARGTGQTAQGTRVY